MFPILKEEIDHEIIDSLCHRYLLLLDKESQEGKAIPWIKVLAG